MNEVETIRLNKVVTRYRLELDKLDTIIESQNIIIESANRGRYIASHYTKIELDAIESQKVKARTKELRQVYTQAIFDMQSLADLT